MRYEQIVVSKRGTVASIEINRPNRRNSLNDETHDELMHALRAVSEDDSTNVLVFTGKGSDFCVGAEMARDVPSEHMLEMDSPEDIRRALRHMQPLTQLLHEMEKPTIGMINGAAAGGGMDLALACDIRIGCPTTRFRSFIQVGIIPGLGGTWLMVQLLGYARACEMFFTAKIMDANEALQVGLLNRIVPEEKLAEVTYEVAEKIAAQAPIALRLGKLLMREALKTDLRTSLEFAAAYQPIVMTASDHTEARTAFLEKRKAKFRGR